MKRLLVPVDFTPRSRRALAYACALAAESGADVDVLHVTHGRGSTDILDARADLEALVDSVAHYGITPRLRVDDGDAASVIVRTARDGSYDLIVMATRGHRGLAELLLGSVAHEVITHAGCPVVTLPPMRSRQNPPPLTG